MPIFLEFSTFFMSKTPEHQKTCAMCLKIEVSIFWITFSGPSPDHDRTSPSFGQAMGLTAPPPRPQKKREGLPRPPWGDCSSTAAFIAANGVQDMGWPGTMGPGQELFWEVAPTPPAINLYKKKNSDPGIWVQFNQKRAVGGVTG